MEKFENHVLCSLFLDLFSAIVGRDLSLSGAMVEIDSGLGCAMVDIVSELGGVIVQIDFGLGGAMVERDSTVSSGQKNIQAGQASGYCLLRGPCCWL